MCNLDEALEFLRRAPAGAALVYAIGEQIADQRHDREKEFVVNLMWNAYEGGVVCLTQRVNEPPPPPSRDSSRPPKCRSFEYIATKTRVAGYDPSLAETVIRDSANKGWRRLSEGKPPKIGYNKAFLVG